MERERESAIKERAIKGKEEWKKRSDDGAGRGGGLKDGYGRINLNCQDLIRGKYSLRASPPLTTNTGLISLFLTHTLGLSPRILKGILLLLSGYRCFVSENVQLMLFPLISHDPMSDVGLVCIP